ncbi:MAG: hypothetical protein ACD_78C00022G0001, partial [uncultured bacterium (gcode 4)]
MQKKQNGYTCILKAEKFISYIFTMIHSYIVNLKEIFRNIILLYRNFLHWNISKICIFLYANIMGFIVSLPFVAVIIYQYFTSYSKLGL